MQESFDRQALPYYPISSFYLEKFGEKVWKIPVSVAETCPNREGLRGMKTCNFCDVWGSAAYPEFRDFELRKQIEATRERLRSRYKAHKFLVYFQAYTSTFSKVERMKKQFAIAHEYNDVCGVVVGTRPDCLSSAFFDLINDYVKKTFVGIELGVQTFDEEQLLWMRRGHTAQKSVWAINKLHAKCPELNIGIHLMFGLPGESDQDVVKAAEQINSLPIHNVKLHNLHVLKNTPLAQDYKQGKFEPISQEAYARRVIIFLQHLKPEIAVHRLAAVASRFDEVVAPRWVMSKMASYQFVLDQFKTQQSFQGQAL